MAFIFGNKKRETLLQNLNVLLAANGQKSIKEMITGAETQVKAMNDQASILEAQAAQTAQAAQAAYVQAIAAAENARNAEMTKVARTQASANTQRAQAQALAAAAADLK